MGELKTKDYRNYSLYRLINIIYNAKKAYYVDGRPILTDQQYDALEQSIKSIHGEKVFDLWNTVGYDAEQHNRIKGLIQQLKRGLREN